MPPSPALRCSPGRELRLENHRRGRSLESGLLQEKDDDLTLFNEMQNKERDNFLLDMSNDLDDSLSTKLKHFSDFKLGISIPVRRESSDLLNADGEKNDYDWLLTPPDTPLFPSLDDDETPEASLASRGRPQTQPISISRSSTMEKSYRTSRSSASPHRLSPSPRSGSNSFQSRGRPSSAPHSSPSPIQRPASPSQRPSTPPTKPSTPAHRSPTPTSRRMSTGSSGIIASSKRGISPVKTSRGNSASPKIRAWQSTIPGFSSDAPPNLRTSLADRPASYVRGSSPASRNGKDAPPKLRRQSMSPTASRSGSSSFGYDRDRFSSQSKGSVASSGDDDIDSLQSLPVSIPDYSAVRRAGAFPNSRAPAFSRKPSKTPSSSSAPKRFSDSVLRQMDHRKSPQNMFRPLLSSVPSTTFYVGKTSTAHRPMVSMNSSVTTSSNASSEQGASAALDTEGSDHDRDDMASDWGKAPYPDAQDEVFVFDKVDDMNGHVNDEVNDGKDTGYADIDRTATTEVKSGKLEKFSDLMSATAIDSAASENVSVENDCEELDGHGRMAYCSICGSKFQVIEPTEGNADLCPDCSEKSGSLTPAAWENPVVDGHNTMFNTEVTLPENKSFSSLELEAEVTEVQEITSRNETMLVQHDENIEQDHNCHIEETQSCLHVSSIAQLMVDGGEKHFVQPTVGSIQSNYDKVDQQFRQSNSHPSLKVDVPEGAGISVLLKRSSSSKWPVVQGRTFAATNVSCDDLSYARDSINSMRSSSGLGSASASSSVDWSSSRQTEVRVQRQLSGRKLDFDNFRHDSGAKLQRTGSSSSGISNPAYQALLLTKSTSEENFDASAGSMDHEAVVETPLVSDDQHKYLSNEKSGESDSSFVRAAVLEADKLDGSETCSMVDASGMDISSRTQCIQLEDASVVAVPNDEDCISLGIAEEFPNCTRSSSDIEIPTMTPQPSSIGENASLNSDSTIEIVEAPAYDSSAMISGELENGGDSIPGSQVENLILPTSSSAMDESSEPSVHQTSEKDVEIPSPASDILDHAHGIPEQSSVTVEGHGVQKARSLTLEEATDTILFCSSIIHNLAYQAATTAMEKESLVHLEGSRPTVTLLGKPSSERKDTRGRTGSKRSLKSQKARQRRVEATVKTPSTKTQIDAKSNESLVNDAEAPHKVESTRPPKLESKCNCTVM